MTSGPGWFSRAKRFDAGVGILLVLAALVALEFTSMDLLLARLVGTPRGFPARDHWLLVNVFHTGGKAVSWAVAAWLVSSFWWPTGALRSLSTHSRARLAITVVGALLLVSTLKRLSGSSCPWDMSDFGGAAEMVPRWLLGVVDGGPGKCFPAGHASAGFAWIAGYFAFRDAGKPAEAKTWLAAALLGGFMLGVAQQVRGAHFMSHTLWTAWICWAWAWAGSTLVTRSVETESTATADDDEYVIPGSAPRLDTQPKVAPVMQTMRR